MTTLTLMTDRLQQDHRQLHSRLQAIRALGDRIDELAVGYLPTELEAALTFLDDRLLPLARAEDAVLYPVVALAMGSSQATATMSRDHLEITRLTNQLAHALERLGDGQPAFRLQLEIRHLLYSIEAIASLHLKKEEELYFPLLDDLVLPDDVDELIDEVIEIAEARSTN
jgi:iron-sulfur cluster repair protein YtfE (RIC family)